MLAHKYGPNHHPRTRNYIVCGLILLLVPILALAYRDTLFFNGKSIRLSTQVNHYNETGLADSVRLKTTLSNISTSKLTGEKSFVTGDKAYLFLSAGPDQIWYPYAISKRPPASGCKIETCLVMTGEIKDVSMDRIAITYRFENFYPTNDIMDALKRSADEVDIRVTLAVNRAGAAIIKNLEIGEQLFDQRNIPKFAPPAFSNFGAKNAPATKPPK